MEKSMKRVEKLVHATNSALAQMRFSLMFDDGLMGGERSFRRAEAFDGDELKQCQHEFTSEANEMLKRMDKMFGSTNANRKNWKALDRIKEINRKMSVVKKERAKPVETVQSREKLLSLIAEEKPSPSKTSGKASLRSKPPPPSKEGTEAPDNHHRTPGRTHPLRPPTHSPAGSKEELKSNILETRQVVARGFHTARHLVQKVDSMTKNERKEKTPCSEKAASETSGRSLDGRSDADGTTRTAKCERHPRKQEKSEDSVREGQQSNARVVDMKRRECGRSGRRNLRVQRLPSVHIRGGLQLQKVHSLEIPGGGGGFCGKANTGIQIMSHEQIEKAKMEKAVDEVRKENWCCSEEVGDAPGNLVECTNCGKVMRIRETRADPRRVDEILRKCNFNVFDPRIDEFVEKCGVMDARRWCEEEREADGGGAVGGGREGEEREVGMDVGGRKERWWAREEKEKAKAGRGCSLEDLSNRVSSKYREEAEALEWHHLRLDSLLKSLLRKIGESREVLECGLLRGRKSDFGRVLTRTEPVVVSLTGSRVESEKKQRSDEKEAKNERRSRAEAGAEMMSEAREGTRMMPSVDVVRRRRNPRRKRKKEDEERRMPRSRSESRSGERTGVKRRGEEDKPKAQSPTSTCSGRKCSPSQSGAMSWEANAEKVTAMSVRGRVGESKTSPGGKSDSVRRPELREERKAADVTSTPSSSSSISSISISMSVSGFSEKQGLGMEIVEGRDRNAEASFEREEMDRAQVEVPVSNEWKAPSEVSTERSENNYESDFESMTNEPEEGGGDCEGAAPEVMTNGNKLSTISEVDSELERKLSDDQKTQRGSLNSDAQADESRTCEEAVDWKQRPVSNDVKGKKSTSLAPGIYKSATGDDTPPEAAEASLKSTPTELVTSLKDILSALKHQFARTETLAEKLTENANKGERVEMPSRECSPSEDGVPSPWKLPVDILVENLRSARKDSTGVAKSASGSCRSQKCEEGGPSADSLSDEGGSSLGEVVASGQRKCDSSSASESRFLTLAGSRRSSRASSGPRETKINPRSKLNVNGDEASSYSEGEIPRNLLPDSECCSDHSVGEVRH